MTYISIADEIDKLLQEGRLKLVPTVMPGSHSRVLYVTPDVWEKIFGPRENTKDRKRMGALQRDLDRFSRGERLTVGHGDEDKCEIKQLDPATDEVWELRSRAPAPSLRIFGRFAEQDVFVGTNMAERRTLKERRSREWAIEVARCRAEWTKLLPYCDPHRGKTSHEYLSNVTDLSDIEKR